MTLKLGGLCVGRGPERVHGDRDREQEEGEQCGSKPRPIADQHAHPAKQRKDTGRGHEQMREGEPLVRGPLDGSRVQVRPEPDRPVCWFLAGAALLDLDARGRRGVDLPRVADTYWPHRANYDRIRRTELDWRLLCPGPMVHEPPLGLDRMRISIDRVPVAIHESAESLSEAELLPLFVERVPEMIVSYADA